MPDKGRRAAAIKYTQGDPAPTVVASGAGLIADRIVAAAHEAGVPVRSDRALTDALAALPLGRDIPEPLWKAVAETLAWAYRLDAASGPR